MLPKPYPATIHAETLSDLSTERASLSQFCVPPRSYFSAIDPNYDLATDTATATGTALQAP